MRVSLFGSNNLRVTKKSTSFRPSALATLVPTLFALTSTTVQVQCFASVTSTSFAHKRTLHPTSAFLNPRGGAAALNEKSTSRLQSTTTTTTNQEGSTDTTSAAASSVMTPAEKLEALRSRMQELYLDVYLVPSDDPHLSGKFVSSFSDCAFASVVDNSFSRLRVCFDICNHRIHS